MFHISISILTIEYVSLILINLISLLDLKYEN